MNYFEYEQSFFKYSHIKSLRVGGEALMAKPFISVIVPTYKRPALLKQTLDSVLNQEGFAEYEVIVIDNDPVAGSETEKLATGYTDKRILYYKNEANIGLIGNFNRGIELARGEWVTVLHDDDLMFPCFLAEMKQAIGKNDMDLVACQFLSSHEPPAVFPKVPQGNRLFRLRPSKFLLCNVTPFPGVVMKRRIAFEIGGFNEKHHPIADYVFWTKCCMYYRCHMLDKKLVFYRTGAQSISSKAYIDVVNASYEFKRQLSERIGLPGFLRKLIIYEGINALIVGYREYDPEGLLEKHACFELPNLHNRLVRTGNRFLCKGLHFLTRYV